MNRDEVPAYQGAGRTWTHPLPWTLAGGALLLAFVLGQDTDTAWLNWAAYLIIGRVVLGAGRLVGVAQPKARKDFINHPVTQVAGVIGATIGYLSTRTLEGALLGGVAATVAATILVAVTMLIRANTGAARNRGGLTDG